jgi:hypothetical protein
VPVAFSNRLRQGILGDVLDVRLCNLEKGAAAREVESGVNAEKEGLDSARLRNFDRVSFRRPALLPLGAIDIGCCNISCNTVWVSSSTNVPHASAVSRYITRFRIQLRELSQIPQLSSIPQRSASSGTGPARLSPVEMSSSFAQPSMPPISSNLNSPATPGPPVSANKPITKAYKAYFSQEEIEILFTKQRGQASTTNAERTKQLACGLIDAIGLRIGL